MNKFDLKVNGVELQVEKYNSNQSLNVVYKIFMNDKYLITYYTLENKRMSSAERLERYLKNFISKEDLIDKVDLDNDLPELLKESIKYCILNESMNEVVVMLLLNYDEFKTRIYLMFLEASKILSQSIDDVLKNTDYNHEDQRANRLNDAFAEVRAVISLNKLGFTNIKLLSSRVGSKGVDIVTFKNNIKYVIDVKHFTDSFQEQYNERFSYGGEYSVEEKFKYNIERIYKEKSDQLMQSHRDQKADKKVLFVVVDETNAFYALNKDDKLRKMFHEIISNLDFIEVCDVILLFNGTLYCS